MPTRASSETPIRGLKTNHAMAIVSKDKVSPTTTAKITAAMATIPERSHPTNGMISKRLMIGEKRK